MTVRSQHVRAREEVGRVLADVGSALTRLPANASPTDVQSLVTSAEAALTYLKRLTGELDAQPLFDEAHEP